MDARLIVVAPQEQAGEYKLNLPALVGRGREATLKLLHPQVSRKHCEIREAGDQLLVRDLGSMNGTYVAGKRIKEQSTLAPGQLLTVGAVTFRAEYDRSAGDETRTDVAALGAAAGMADLGPDATPTERFDEQAYLAGDDERGHNPPGFDPDWLQGARSEATETRSGDMSLEDTFRDESHSPRRDDSPDVGLTQGGASIDPDDLPAISFDEDLPAEAEGSADDFDPLEVLGSPDASGEQALDAGPDSEELRNFDLEPFAESSDMPEAAASGTQASDEIELEPLDVPMDEGIGEVGPADWGLLEEDASAGESPEKAKGNERSGKDDDDLDDFLKDLK